ncbi:MAG: small multi-drug export protein, partial [bacterium]
MSPVVELRGAIPVAIGAYGLSSWAALGYAFLGNMVPLTMILLLLDPVSHFFSERSSLFNNFFNWLYSHTRSKNEAKTEKLGKNLTVFVLSALPIPLVGGWTGA